MKWSMARALQAARFYPGPGGLVSSLVEVYWRPRTGLTGRSELQVTYDPVRTPGSPSVPGADVVEQFVTIGGATGYPLAITVDGVKVPLGIVHSLDEDGMIVVPDASMRTYVPSEDRRPGLD